MVVAAFPPIIAILLALGGLGWANFNLNMFLNVMTPLIMVISFSDSMQLTFAARDRLIAGQDKLTAFTNAVLVVGPGLRADPRHRRHFVHRAAVLRFRTDPQIRRGRACRHHHRADRGAVAGAGVRRAVRPQREDLRGQVPERRRRRAGAAQFLLLDRGAHGQPPRAVQPDRAALRRRPRLHLRHAGAALPARRPGAGQAAGGGGVEPSRRQAHRRQSDRRADRIPQGRLALCAGYAEDDRRSSRDGREIGRRRQRLVARNPAPLARREGRQQRRRDAEGICQRDPRASGPPLHLGRSGCGGGFGPRARPRFQRDPSRGRQARQGARQGARRASRLSRSRSPACRRSPRATAPT